MQTNIQNSGNQMLPLLMTFTRPTPIQEYEPEVFNYDEVNQISYEMRIVGTKSLRHHGTTKRGGKTVSYCDAKNEIDDSKSVR